MYKKIFLVRIFYQFFYEIISRLQYLGVSLIIIEAEGQIVALFKAKHP